MFGIVSLLLLLKVLRNNMKSALSKMFSTKIKSTSYSKPVSSFIENPKFIWSMVVVLGLILLIGSAIFSSFLFLKISSGGVFQVDKNESKYLELINRNKLDSVLNAYRNKAETFEELKRIKPLVIDPSI
jgi:hypothetical protein